MRRSAILVPALLGALALAAPAEAKELTGLKLCGASGCAEAKDVSLGHEPPFTVDATFAPAAPGPFYRLDLEVDGHADAWSLYYVPPADAVATRDEGGLFLWGMLRGRGAVVVRELARRVEPFPPPKVTSVSVGTRTVRARAGSYLDLYRVEGEFEVPGSSKTISVRLDSAVPSPWTDGSLMYYPAGDVLRRAPSEFGRLPSRLAANLAAGRPLDSLADGGFPWLPVGLGVLGGLALPATALQLLRRRPRRTD